MAIEPLSTTRRAILGAAASLPVAALAPIAPAAVPPVRPEPVEGLTSFARRLARYRRFAERTREAAETGFFRAANDRYDRERAEIEARFGSWEAAAATPEGRKRRRAVFEPIAAAEEAFWHRCTKPMQQAAALLALTPAPDLPALLAKIRVMQAQEMDELEILGRSVLEVLAEDVERLAEF